jgi:hypothetical protein
MALLDTNPLAQLFGQEQYGQMKNEALNMGALNAIAQLLAASGAQARPVGTGQAIGQALLGGYQGYQGAMDKNLNEMLKATQISEMLRKQEETKQLKSLYASAATPKYEITKEAVIPQGQTLRDDQGQLTMGATPEEKKLTGYTYDINKIAPVLASMGRWEELANIEKALPVLGGGTMKMTDVPSQVKEAVSVLGIKDDGGRLKTPDKFTDDDRLRVQRYIEKSDINKAPKINTADPTAVAQAAAGNVKDFNAQVKDYREVGRRYNAMVGAWKDKANPATDSTLIYGLAKIYDPSGAVQQGDINTIKGSRSIPQNVIGFADRVARGGTLTETERNNIMSTAYNMVNSYSKNVQNDVDTYRSFAKDFGADPNQIRSPFENMEKPDYLYFTIAGKQVKADKGKDGAYYVQRGNQYYKVSE